MMRYVLCFGVGVILASAVFWMRAVPAIGGEWFLPLIAPAFVWIWKDVRG